MSHLLALLLLALTTAPATPPNYALASANDSGQSLFVHKANCATVQSALEHVFPDLAAFYGNRPKIGSSYQDAKDPHRGGATFTASWNGHPVRGIISCTIDPANTAAVAVIFCRADAPRADFDALMNPPTTQPTEAAAPNPAAHDPASLLAQHSSVYSFPDGTGSITLADGWTCQSQTAINLIRVEGPDRQSILLNNTAIVSTPDSPMVQTQKRNQAMMRQMSQRTGSRMPMPAGPPMLIAAFTDPVQAVQDLTPQVSAMTQARNGMTIHLDQIISHQDLPPAVSGGKAALIRYRVTRAQNGQPVQYDNFCTIQMTQTGNGVWTYTYNGFNGPTETFDRDKPLMFAMFSSLKLNADVCSQRLNEQSAQNMAMIKQQGQQLSAQLQANHDQWMHEQDQRNAAYQAYHDQQMAGYAAHNEQWKSDELQKQRNAADFIETIKGTRTVYDSVTGERTSVSLYDVNGIVDAANQAALDPNRFIQIPLRDEMYPVTGN